MGIYPTGEHTNRRRVMRIGGAAGMALVAGCTGDAADDMVDDGDDDDVADGDLADDADIDDVDDGVDDTDDIDDTDDGDDTDEIERFDVVASQVIVDPHPGDAQYSRWSSPSPGWAGFTRYHVLRTSFYDFEPRSTLLTDYSYEPGIIEGTFRDDVYWWSGDQFTVEDFLLDLEFRDWLDGGDDFTYNPNIIAAEQIDSDSFRISLADTWNETWALQQSLVQHPDPDSSRVFLE